MGIDETKEWGRKREREGERERDEKNKKEESVRESGKINLPKLKFSFSSFNSPSLNKLSEAGGDFVSL